MIHWISFLLLPLLASSFLLGQRRDFAFGGGGGNEDEGDDGLLDSSSPTPAPFASLLDSSEAPTTVVEFEDLDGDGGNDGFPPQSCDDNWEQTAEDYRNVVNNIWQSPTCYTFTLERQCRCLTEYRGPWDITVENGIVTSMVPDLDYSKVTMDDLFDMIDENCVATCPTNGASLCGITYGVNGNVESMYIDPMGLRTHDEIIYLVTNFATC